MLAELRRGGYDVEHDRENLRPDGAAWLESLEE